MKEGKEFRITSKDNMVFLEITGKISGSIHKEGFPPKVAVAMGNQLVRQGRELLQSLVGDVVNGNRR